VYLFGSQARGTAGPASDVDLGALLVGDPPITLEGLGIDLAGVSTLPPIWKQQSVATSISSCSIAHRRT